MSLFSLILAAAAASSTAALPAEPDTTAGASKKKICKMITMTGSRVGGQRVCFTKAQWDEQFRLGQDNGREMLKNSARPKDIR